jgi:imidazolonepropionase-like amidohydrolase
MIIQWPTIQTRSFDFSTFSVTQRPFAEAKKEYDEQLATMESWFEAAEHYRQAAANGDASKFNRDLQLEHLARTLGGDLPVIIVANDKRSIEGAIELAERYDMSLILAGARDAREVKATLAEKGIPVILGPTQTLPARVDDPYYYPFSLAGELYEAGVSIAFGTFNSSDSRTLPYEAANAVPFGLPYEEALKAITVYPAEILGVSDRLGTIEVGKMANLIVTDGNPLEIQTQVSYVFIDGMPVDMDNRHRRLFELHDGRPARTQPTTTAARENGS